MKHGIVTSSSVAKSGHLSLTIQSSRNGVTWSNVPVAQNQPGAIQNIEEGWHVALEECDDGLWICVGVLNANADENPSSLDAREQSVVFDDGTEVSTLLNDNGNYDISVKSSGNVYIDAGGDVLIGDPENAEAVAKQNHTHNYSWSDSGGSGTTDQPNEPGTETAVE